MSLPVLRSLPIRLATLALAGAVLATPSRAASALDAGAVRVDVQVLLTTAAGSPVTGAVVEARSGDGRTLARTDLDGRAVLRLPAQDASRSRLQVRADLERPVGGSLPVVHGASNTFGQGGPNRMATTVSVVEGGVTP